LQVEYESEPTERLEQYQGQSEAGEFESHPQANADVVRSGDKGEDYQPEKGYAKNIMNRFKGMEAYTGPNTVGINILCYF